MKKTTDESSGYFLPRTTEQGAQESGHSDSQHLQSAYDTRPSSRVRGWFRGMFDETLWSIRKETDRARAHKEYYQTTAEAVEAMHDLEMTPERVVDTYNRSKEQATLDHQVAKEQKLHEIEKIQLARKRLADEDTFERTKIHDAIATFKSRHTPAPSSAETTNDEHLDPDMRKARAVMDKLRRKARMEEELERFRKEQFAAIEADVTNGTLTPEEAQRRKDRLQEQINFELQEL